MCLELNTTQSTTVPGSIKKEMKVMNKSISPELPINKTPITRKPNPQEEVQNPERVEISEKGIIL